MIQTENKEQAKVFNVLCCSNCAMSLTPDEQDNFSFCYRGERPILFSVWFADNGDFINDQVPRILQMGSTVS